MIKTKHKTFSMNEDILNTFENLCANKAYKQSKIMAMLIEEFCKHEMEIFKK